MSYISFKNIFQFDKNTSSLIKYRLISYFIISIGFYFFMKTHAPLGIEWRPFHFERISNAIKNIFENYQLSFLGYTSWFDVKDVKLHLEGSLKSTYLTSIFPFLFHALMYKLNANYDILKFGSLIDYFLISLLGFLIAEIGIKLFTFEKTFESIIYGSVIFTFFLSSPWTYRMILAPWPEVWFLGLYLLSNYFFICGRRNLGLLALSFGVLMQWTWGALFLMFMLIIKVLHFLYNTSFNRNSSYLYLPPGLENKKGYFLYSLACLIPIIFTFVQFIISKFMGLSHAGGKILYRVGVDSIDNIHHGGLLGALQFLGGNRYSLCFDSDGSKSFSELDNYISIFNCSLSITSLVILSLIALIGVIMLLKNVKISRFVLLPISWSFFFYFLIFQQSFAVHLQGHSFVFSLLFSVGLTYILKLINHRIIKSKIIGMVIIFPLSLGITINLIRVCYITGFYG